jgi:hypothetical protein
MLDIAIVVGSLIHCLANPGICERYAILYEAWKFYPKLSMRNSLFPPLPSNSDVETDSNSAV